MNIPYTTVSAGLIPRQAGPADAALETPGVPGDQRSTPVTDGGPIVAAARELVAGLTRAPLGRSSPSVYETGRLVALAPWLSRHDERVAHLLERQRPDGSWGAPDGYALVPTLSATDALFTELLRTEAAGGPPIVPTRLSDAVGRGLRALSDWLRPGARLSVPDLPATDLTVPALLESINAGLDRLAPAGVPTIWPGVRRLVLPAGITADRLARVRAALAAGSSVPEKLLHALEVVPELAPRAAGVTAVDPGTVGASPAATVAWLGPDGGTNRSPVARAFLEQVVAEYGGPVPCALPIAVFERSWVLSGLARARVPVSVPNDLVESLIAPLGPAGTPAGPGLPADADTTSVVLTALSQLGVAVDAGCLDRYRTATHYCTWAGEDGVSITTNAHVLDALGQQRRLRPDRSPRYGPVVRQLSGWLCEQQQADGSWQDRWHASPYYATACCVLALVEHADTPLAGPALSGAVDWVVGTQRPDGSWGRWAGTVEETAYALQVLFGVVGPPRPGVGAAAVRGIDWLAAADGELPDPPLWHDKDLYLPPAIVRAATVSAWQLAESRSDLVMPDELSRHRQKY